MKVFHQSPFVSSAIQTSWRLSLSNARAHTLLLPGLCASAVLCVFNYVPSDRPLLHICRFLSVCSLVNGYATDIIGGEGKRGIKEELYGNQVCQKNTRIASERTLKAHVYNKAPLSSSCKVASGKNSTVGTRLQIMCQCFFGAHLRDQRSRRNQISSN